MTWHLRCTPLCTLERTAQLTLEYHPWPPLCHWRRGRARQCSPDTPPGPAPAGTTRGCRPGCCWRDGSHWSCTWERESSWNINKSEFPDHRNPPARRRAPLLPETLSGIFGGEGGEAGDVPEGIVQGRAVLALQYCLHSPAWHCHCHCLSLSDHSISLTDLHRRLATTCQANIESPTWWRQGFYSPGPDEYQAASASLAGRGRWDFWSALGSTQSSHPAWSLGFWPVCLPLSIESNSDQTQPLPERRAPVSHADQLIFCFWGSTRSIIN